MSWITPISLLTNITETRIVSGRSAAFELLEVEQAVFLRRRGRSTSKPWRSSSRMVSSTALCSVFTVMRCLPLRLVELRRALEREVVRLGRARGPDDLARVGVDQRGDLLARLLDRLLRLPAAGMAARRRVAEVLAQPRDHRVDDARIDRRRRAVVQVDREMRGHVHGGRLSAYDLAKALPSANTEFGAVTLDRLDDRLGRDRPLDRVLLDRDALGELLVDQLLQRDRIEELDHLGVQAGPQVVRHAAAGVVAHAVFLAAAAVASIGSSTATMMSATVISSALRPRV